MKKSILIIVILFSLAIFVLFQKNDKKEENTKDIPVDNNITQYSTKIIPLEEDLDKNRVFASPNKMIDYNNNIVISDHKLGTISFFDYNGKFLKKIGGRGEGPDEFKNLYDFDISKDKVYGLMGKGIKILDLNGKFVKFIPLKFYSSDFSVIDEENIFFSKLTDRDPNKPNKSQIEDLLFKINGKGEILWKGMKTIPFKNGAFETAMNFFIIIKGDNNIFALRECEKEKKHILYEYESQDKPLKEISMDKRVVPVKVSGVLKNTKLKAYSFCKNACFYNNKIYMQLTSPVKKRDLIDFEESKRIAVFDLSGKLLHYINLPMQARKILVKDEKTMFVIDIDSYELIKLEIISEQAK